MNTDLHHDAPLWTTIGTVDKAAALIHKLPKPALGKSHLLRRHALEVTVRRKLKSSGLDRFLDSEEHLYPANGRAYAQSAARRGPATRIEAWTSDGTTD